MLSLIFLLPYIMLTSSVQESIWGVIIKLCLLTTAKAFLNIGCVRLASLGWPWTASVRSNSFDDLPGGSPGWTPQCPACGVGHLGAGPRCMTSIRQRWVIVRLALVRGSPEWAPRSIPREAKRTHPMIPHHAMPQIPFPFCYNVTFL